MCVGNPPMCGAHIAGYTAAQVSRNSSRAFAFSRRAMFEFFQRSELFCAYQTSMLRSIIGAPDSFNGLSLRRAFVSGFVVICAFFGVRGNECGDAPGSRAFRLR